MNIRRISTWTEHFELTRPYTIAFRTVDSVRNGIVRIETDDGSTGLGCASPEEFVTGETWDACDAALAEPALQWLVGRGVHELAALCRELRERFPGAPAARAAVDIALHDLWAKRLGVPLADALGRRLQVADDIWREELDENDTPMGWDWDRMREFFNETDMPDPHGIARTWAVVLAYLMTDPRYLHL